MSITEYGMNVRLRMAIGNMEAGREVGGSVLVAFDPRAHARALELLKAIEMAENAVLYGVDPSNSAVPD